MPIRNRLLAVRLHMAADLGREVSQKEFAEMVGVAQPQYSRYERQERQPHIEIAIQIANKLGLKLDDLFEQNQAPE